MKESSSALYRSVLAQVRRRISAGSLTQARVGEALRLRQSAVSYLLQGKTKLSLEQFLALSHLLGEKAHRILAEADAGLLETRPLSPSGEEVLHQGPMPLLAFAAAARPVRARDLASPQLPEIEWEKALQALAKVGLLVSSGGSFRQTEPLVQYRPQTGEGNRRRFLALRDIHRIGQEAWFRRHGQADFFRSRPNVYTLTYLTEAQARALAHHFFEAQQMLHRFEKKNGADDFAAPGESYTLWNAHFSLAAFFDEDSPPPAGNT